MQIRPWSFDDLESLVHYANNPKIADNLTNGFPNPYTTAAGKVFIEKAMSGAPTSVFAIEIDGKAVGGIGLHPQSDILVKNAELGYWLGEPFWGKGIVTQAILQIIPYGFENFDINRIFARPFGSNIGSQRVLEKAGFVLEARLHQTIFKNNRYEDELIYAIRRTATPNIAI